jgi:ATP-dependent Lon protease
MIKLQAPFFGIRGSVLPPGVQRSFVCGRERTVRALKDGVKDHGNKIIAITQRQIEENHPSSFKDFFEYGTLCEIESYAEYPDQSAKVIIVGIELVKIADLQMSEVNSIATYIKIRNNITAADAENFRYEPKADFEVDAMLIALYQQDEKTGVDAAQLVRLNMEVKKLQESLEVACMGHNGK